MPNEAERGYPAVPFAQNKLQPIPGETRTQGRSLLGPITAKQQPLCQAAAERGAELTSPDATAILPSLVDPVRTRSELWHL